MGLHDVTKRTADRPDLGAVSKLAPELATTCVTSVNEIALVLDTNGVIRNVALGGAEPLATNPDSWVGRSWADTVTEDTRRKVDQLLQEVVSTGVSRRREVNHRSPLGVDIPIAYSAVQLGASGPVLAVGRDLRAVAAIQQRFVDTQHEMERDYWRMRQSEARYRQLFQVATDAVCVVDSSTLTVLDANRAALGMLGAADDHLIGKPASAGVDVVARPAMDELLSSARALGRPSEIRVKLAGRDAYAFVSATPFRSRDVMLLLMRARPAPADDKLDGGRAHLVELVERSEDAVLIVDSGARVLMANPAFLRMAQLERETDATGRALGDWVGESERQLTKIVAAARGQGMVQQVTLVRGAMGREIPVELSASLLPDGERECIGLTLRPLTATSGSSLSDDGGLVSAIEHLSANLGARGLPEMINEVTERAERHFLKLALKRAEGDVAAAAESLGISAQSLYLRSRRLRLLPNDFEDPARKGP